MSTHSYQGLKKRSCNSSKVVFISKLIRVEQDNLILRFFQHQHDSVQVQE